MSTLADALAPTFAAVFAGALAPVFAAVFADAVANSCLDSAVAILPAAVVGSKPGLDSTEGGALELAPAWRRTTGERLCGISEDVLGAAASVVLARAASAGMGWATGEMSRGEPAALGVASAALARAASAGTDWAMGGRSLGEPAASVVSTVTLGSSNQPVSISLDSTRRD